ncbi:MAG: 30S ribosomal protein S12 methylthiotransferase RimO [Actinobacteria bacterium]|nr:30S ribosomal protein S12 methylthiotransferase RimO [Actinomycetota bacterium]
MPDAPAIAFVTLGCPKNEVDSDRMAAAALAAGFRIVPSTEDADVAVLNTCAFIQAATEESIAEALALVGAWREARPGRKVVVAGCMVSRYGDDLREAMPEPDAFVAVADEGRIAEVLAGLLDRQAIPTPAAAVRTTPGPTAYLKVSEGCDRGCTYCAIPSIRGRFVSTPLADLLVEASFLVGGGAKELVLVGQDIASYGHDLTEPCSLAELVTALDALESDFRIRLMYLQPDGVTDELLEAIGRSARVCHYLDIPLQHASAEVLDAMGRSGDSVQHRRLVARIRKALPGIALRTTVIAGFPGETEEHAAELEAFLAEVGFDFVGVFPFSPEEGTPAASMPGQVPEDVRLARAQRLRDTADDAGFARAAALVDTVQSVLVDGYEDGELIGRTATQAPEVDGITAIQGDLAVGTLADVRIIAAAGYDLVGVPV